MGLLYELATGSGSREYNNGISADTYVRRFKFIKATPNESYSVPDTAGIYIGSPFPVDSTVTCVSYSDEPEGSSRLVRNFTFTYKSIPATSTSGSSGGGGGQSPPNVQPPNLTFNFDVDRVATFAWFPDPAGAPNTYEPAVDKAGEPIDGLTKPQASGTIQVKQFVTFDPAGSAGWVGYLNDRTITWGSFSAAPRTLMFKGFNANPTVKSWGSVVYRGWDVTFSFSYRENRQWISSSEEDGVGGYVNIGWDKAVPLTARNIKNSVAKTSKVEGSRLALQHDANNMLLRDGTGDAGLNGYYWATDPRTGAKAIGTFTRAMQVVPAPAGGFRQIPCNEPVAVNLDGSPRTIGMWPIIYRRGDAPETNLIANLGVRAL